MLGTPKPMASLSSSLLARKGQARPAMRPQGFVGLSPGTTQDDLGWNDMGEEPAPAPAKPEVLRQIEALDEQISQPAPAPAPAQQAAPEPVAAAAEPAPAPPRRTAAPPSRTPKNAAAKTKFAFTLRLDNDRHLRLRLASALSNRSAQQLVCQALDAFLESMTEVEALARQVDPAKDQG